MLDKACAAEIVLSDDSEIQTDTERTFLISFVADVRRQIENEPANNVRGPELDARLAEGAA